MTYWPISAPSVFAASKHGLPKECIATTDDGAQKAKSSSSSRENGNAILTQDGEEPQSPAEEASETQALVNGEHERNTEQRSDEEDPLESEIGGEIICLRVTRNGSMFATITRSTLTIWQTKVRSL
jgi:RAB6A-GEF complex partner protein 1